ncbi:MAG: T9SS type A sorting domain-containing protein [Candidatus Delongbacteria bacterium]|jgi:hypothetical protein|nr:T9SS type A sorting domain-containing protein [Candidatus Delongbacteria bacterium]
MKNKILIYTFLLILTLSPPLFSQSGWSDPVQVSGIYWCTDPAISVDNNGVLYAFWLKHIKLDVGYYSTVYFSQSLNGGLNWTAPINITPESTSVLWETRAVTDSRNNIHIIYAKGLESKVLIYKKYDGSTWTDDHVININLNANMRYGIDTTDRIFATWSLNSTTYYMYCDTKMNPTSWSIPKKIHPNTNYLTLGFVFDTNNNIYAIGKNDTDTSIGSCVFEYSRIDDIWYNFEQIHSFEEKYLGCAIAFSHNDSLYANMAVGNSLIENNDFQNQKQILDSSWAIPVNIDSKNNWWNRSMFVDRDNTTHVFEVNDENDIHSLNHTFGKGTSWQTETIHSDPNFYIPWFDVKRRVFEDHDEYYVLYGKSGNINGTPTSRINFQTKSITTGIENQSANIIESTTLYQNYPNPFNNSTQISYSIPQTANVKLSVYNIKGELVKDLINARQNKGQHSVIFNAGDLNSGIYFYSLEVDGVETENRKMLYLK